MSPRLKAGVRLIARRREAGLVVALGALVVGVGAANPAFLAPAAVADLLADAAPVVILACAAALVILTGEIDVSIGSQFGALAVLLGILASPQHANCPAWVAAPAVLIAGAGVGALNGVLVGVVRVPSIIVTLGMLAVLRGVAELALGGMDITDLPPALRAIGTGNAIGVHNSVWGAVIIAAGTWAFLRRTAPGMRLYAAGDNAEAAVLAGVRVDLVKLGAFALAGGLVAVAVVVSVPRLPKVESGLGVGYELLAISAAVVGGVSVRGGVGTVAGVVLGALLLSTVRPALLFLKLGLDATFWERAIQGAFILGAVGLDRAISAQREPDGGLEIERGPWRRAAVLHTVGLGAVLIGILVIAGRMDPKFISAGAQVELLTQASEVALLAVPMALVILAGGIDLSVGSIMAVAAVTIGIAFERGCGFWGAAGLGIAAGGMCGALNGVIVAGARIHPLIVTLATMALFRGLAEGVSGARPVSVLPPWAVERTAEPGLWSSAGALLVPSVLAFVLAWAALQFTVPGWTVRAVGFNETVCRFAALRVDRLKIALYTLSGACAGLAAVLFIARRHTAKADAGLGIELDVITAVVLGGVSVRGGRGSIAGVALGVLLLHELRQFIGWRWQSEEVVPLAVGVVLIAAAVVGGIGALRSRNKA